MFAGPWMVLPYNPYDVDGDRSSDVYSLHSRLHMCHYATEQKSGEEA